MSGYKDLEIYKEAFRLAIQIHPFSLKLPNYELYEQGSQLRRSTESIKDQIAEGYGRRKYKADFVKFLVYAQASCYEALNQIETIMILYSDIKEFSTFFKEY